MDLLKFAVAVFASALFFTACATQSEDTPDPTMTPSLTTPTAVVSSNAEPTPRSIQTPTPTPTEWRTVGATVWEDTFHVTLEVQGASMIGSGQSVSIRTHVENISESPAQYTLWSSADPVVPLWVVPPYSGLIPLVAPPSGDASVFLPTIGIETLLPGESIITESIWDGRVLVGGESLLAPNDVYTIRADFFPGAGVGSPAQPPIILTHAITVTGNVSFASSDEIRSLLSKEPVVQWWLAAHQGGAIARDEGGSYSVNVTTQWKSATHDEYNAAFSENVGPTLWLTSSGWRATYNSAFGFAPKRMIFEVDGLTSNVTSITPDLEAELQDGVVATFQAMDGSIFRVFARSRSTVDQLFTLQDDMDSGESILVGTLLSGPGPGLQNAPWSWHFDPSDARLTHTALEACTGTPASVENALTYWQETVGALCIQDTTLIALEDHRS